MGKYRIDSSIPDILGSGYTLLEDPLGTVIVSQDA